MTGAFLIGYLGGALVYAGLATAICLVGLLLSARRVSTALILLLMSGFFVIFLGIHPFPDRAAMVCDGGVAPILRPFQFLDAYVYFWQQGRPLSRWMTSLNIVSPIMNVVFFMPVGVALCRLGVRWWGALAGGLALSGFIEIAQLTALFGIYPCRYRHFEVDDLILNSSGVLLGFAVAALWARRTR